MTDKTKDAPRGRELFALGVVEIVSGLRSGLFTAADVMASCLGRIEAREPVIEAWTAVDSVEALRNARTDIDLSLPLAGVPFGVKDVIDTAGLSTEMGSKAYDAHHARYDAGCVGLARMAGAIVVGKTVTAEFAGTQPTRTANPHMTEHTPGGSSSGSAAAVADLMVPFAFGTQTGGSVLRPAAFCGVVGFKPSYHFYPIAGMKPAAQSFDTVGLIARSVEDVSLVHSVLMSASAAGKRETPPRIGIFRSHLWETVEADAVGVLEQAITQLSSAGAVFREITAPAGFETITQQRAVINAFERARGLAGEWFRDRDLFAPESRAVCERGFAVSGEEYVAARRVVEAFRSTVSMLFADVDFLLTPATPGEAPFGKDYAGDPRLQELWTMLHLPSLTLPAGLGRRGLPISIQLVGPRFGDDQFLGGAQWVSAKLPSPVSPFS